MDSIQAAAEAEAPKEEQVSAVEGETAVPATGRPADRIMSELPVADWDYQQPRRGQIRPGVILSIGEQEIIVGLDAKRDGVVPFADIQRMGAEALSKLSVGDRVDVYVLQPEDQEGALVVSLFQAWQARAWQEATELFEKGEIWEAQVIGYNKGGLVVPVGELRGFIPASQISGFPQGLDQDERLRRMSTMVGQTLRVKVIEINRRNRRLILSALAAEREWRQLQREHLMGQLREGEVRRGHVSSLASFGVFVDLGGAEGLVHLSELSWRRVRHPKEVVRVGDEVEVYVLRLDEENKRIGLSLKRLQPEPWALVEDKYELGQLVEGTITNVADFGAFALIEEGVEGLIHVSELTDQPISHPRDIVKRGDLLLLRIVRIDLRRKRLGLSLRRVLESEWTEWATRQSQAEASTEAPVRATPSRRAPRLSKPIPRVPEIVPQAPASAEPEPVAVDIAEELVPLDVAEEPMAVDAAEEPVAVGAAEEPVAVDAAEAPLLVDAAEGPVAVDVAEEPMAVDAAEEPMAVGAAEEPVAVDVAEEPLLVDAAEAPLLVDAVEEPLVVDAAEEPMAVGAGEEPVAVDVAEEPLLVDAAEEPLPVDAADAPAASDTAEELPPVRTASEPLPAPGD